MTSMEWTCKNCGGVGRVRHPTSKIEESMLIVCSHCSTPSAYAWCDKCGVGAEVTGINFSSFQRSWKCVNCSSVHNLSKDFYEDKIVFTPKEFLDLKQLRLEEDVRNQKHLPEWVKSTDKFFNDKRRYFMYAMLVTLLLFIVTFGVTVSLMYLKVCNLNDTPVPICSITFYVSIGLLVLLGSIPLLHALAGMLWGILNTVFLVTYKLKKIRE